MATPLTHVGNDNRPKMVDVSDKQDTVRSATAQSKVIVPPEVAACFVDGEYTSAKGPVLDTAIIAGTMAVKKTSDLIPFCHPLQINGIDFSINTDTQNEIIIECTVKLKGKTGVEMEALTGASVAALTVYDMCKALSHEIIIAETRLLKKSGGKSDINVRN